MAVMQSRKPSLSVIEMPRFHGYGMEAPLAMLQENLPNAERVQLFPAERIAFLDIRFGELFHRCTEQEWVAFRQLLVSNGFNIRAKRPWWHFFARQAI